MQIGVVVVTHGQLATELVNSAEMIVGDLPHFTAVSIGWHDDVDQAREEIGRAIERVSVSAGTDGQRAPVLVLSDMFGGTPANLAVTFVSENVEVITGVNLPMLIKLARPQKAADLLTVAREMREHGRNAIWVASDLLRGEKSEKSEKSEKGSKAEKTKTGSTGASGKDDA
jgi:PTS system mannose-specific IIA component